MDMEGIANFHYRSFAYIDDQPSYLQLLMASTGFTNISEPVDFSPSKCIIS